MVKWFENVKALPAKTVLRQQDQHELMNTIIESCDCSIYSLRTIFEGTLVPSERSKDRGYLGHQFMAKDLGQTV